MWKKLLLSLLALKMAGFGLGMNEQRFIRRIVRWVQNDIATKKVGYILAYRDIFHGDFLEYIISPTSVQKTTTLVATLGSELYIYLLKLAKW